MPHDTHKSPANESSVDTPPSRLSRRKILQLTGGISTMIGSGVLTAQSALAGHHAPSFFKISLAQWSLHRAFKNGVANPKNFAKLTKTLFDIRGIEYVNQFYMDSYSDTLTRELKKQADGEGVESLLIMVDREGDLGAGDKHERKKTVENHHRWAHMAKALGCHSIRVNARSVGSYNEQMKSAADGLRQLGEYCDSLGINVLVENHGGLSSNGEWLAGVMKLADHSRVGTLPDFGNFVINRETGESYDRYKGVTELMPWAKAVSAKSFEFDNKGDATQTDFYRMMNIVKASNYKGWVGIEYEGNTESEIEGIMKTKALLEKIQKMHA